MYWAIFTKCAETELHLLIPSGKCTSFTKMWMNMQAHWKWKMDYMLIYLQPCRRWCFQCALLCSTRMLYILYTKHWQQFHAIWRRIISQNALNSSKKEHSFLQNIYLTFAGCLGAYWRHIMISIGECITWSNLFIILHHLH